MSTEGQRSLRIQIVLFWAGAIIVGAIGSMIYLNLMPTFDEMWDMQEFMNRMMYAASLSIVFGAVAAILAVIGIVKVLQYLKT